MVEGIEWLGHDSFRITGSRTIYVDPWKLGAGQPTADIILVTHDHFDHFDKGDIKALSGPDTVVVGPPAVTSGLGGSAVTMSPGDSRDVRGVSITAVPAYNTNKRKPDGSFFHPPEAGYVGYVVDLDGRRIYHAGDTDNIPELRDIDVDVALVPVSGTYTMTADEAVQACEVLNAKVVVPMHYGDVAGSADDAEELRRRCRHAVEVLQLTR
jgi:L-ascorbate metabolism protein UlaG (beta-lactamase superfamily)